LRLRFIAPVAVVLALVVSSFALAARQAASVAAPIKITVTLSDYAFKFSRTSVPVGSTVTFALKNTGTVQHNIDFVGTGKRSALIAAGGKGTLKVTFKKKGSIQVVCDVPRHIQLGMVSSFKVK
jgi:plastocyanin